MFGDILKNSTRPQISKENDSILNVFILSLFIDELQMALTTTQENTLNRGKSRNILA